MIMLPDAFSTEIQDNLMMKSIDYRFLMIFLYIFNLFNLKKFCDESHTIGSNITRKSFILLTSLQLAIVLILSRISQVIMIES